MQTSVTVDYRTLFESLSGLYLVLSPTLHIVAVTDEYLKATLTRRSEVIGRSVFDVFPDNPNDPNASGVRNLYASLERVLQTHAPDAMAVQKYDVARPDGTGFEDKYWSPLNTPIFNDRKELLYILHRAEDVTEFMRLKQKGNEQEKINNAMRSDEDRVENEIYIRAQQIQEANSELRKAEKLKDEFFAGVSHELRTPLTLILAPLESILTGPADSLTEKQRTDLRVIHNNAIRLLQLVNSLLDHAKLQAKKSIAHRESTDVAELTHSLFADFRPRLEQKGLRGECECTPETGESDRGAIYVSIDRYMYERILFNLLSNAVKFTDIGGQVAVRLRQEADHLILQVTDTGIGIAESEQADLFKRFRQVDQSSTRQYEGTGLGLALVKDFAGLMQGSVKVESRPGHGSVFTVRILAPTAVSAGADIMRTEPLPIYSGDIRREENSWDLEDAPRVLVAEDNNELAVYIAGMLKSWCSVRWAENGEAALLMAREWLPDLILSDIMMPVRDGYSLCKAVKADPRLAKTPVVLLTALIDRESLLKGWNAGADEYLFKPFHPEELVTRVKTLLANTHERMELDRRMQHLNAELEARVKQRTEQLMEYAGQLNQQMAELEQFAFIASHDLQEPLRTLLGFVSLLDKKYKPLFDDRALQYMRFIIEATVRMQALITDLLEYSRIGRDHKKLEMDCNRIMKAVVSDLDAQIKRIGAVVEWEDLPSLIVYPTEFRLLLQNLISNAIKFSQPGIVPRVRIYAKNDGDTWTFCVADNGIGIEARHYERIFLIFQRLHMKEDYEGSGIGLAFCKKIVELHKGKIWLESVLGEGSQFYFTIKDEKFYGPKTEIKLHLAGG